MNQLNEEVHLKSTPQNTQTHKAQHFAGNNHILTYLMHAMSIKVDFNIFRFFVV